MTQLTAADFSANLVGSLRQRLKEIEAEKGAITRALRVLEVRSPASSRNGDLTSGLLESLKTSPGARSSLLALEFGVETALVAALLGDLEARGTVVRHGLGWELSNAAQTGARSPRADQRTNVVR